MLLSPKEFVRTYDNPEYWDEVHRVALQLQSDGCSWATECYQIACFEHDIHYRQHATIHGQPVTKDWADEVFYLRMVNRSWLGEWSVIARVRFLAVDLFGQRAFDHDDTSLLGRIRKWIGL